MGSADIVPGVSGGTIALITGIYERLVHAISSIKFGFIKPLLKLDFSGFKTKLLEEIDFQLFIPLLLGIGIAFLTLAKVVTFAMNNYAGYTFSFFLGLILASSYVLYVQLGKFSLKTFVMALIGVILSFIFVGLNPIAANHSLIVIFFSGMIAICAMILPGISGSFILLLIGQYEYMLSALSSMKIPEIITFIFGALIGILGFSKILNFLIENHKEITMAFLIGIMIGTLRIPVNNIVMDVNCSWILCFILVLIGFVLIVVLENKFNYVEE